MLRLIQLILFGHFHKWKILRDHGLTLSGKDVGNRYILQCEICGSLKQTDIY